MYELKPLPTPNATAPTYVIALRGTLPSVKKDMLENARIGVARLHRSSRFRLVQKAIRKYASIPPADGGPPKIVWIAGHSLGASLATLVGKWMAKKGGVFGNSHETFLFNPPYGSAPIDKIKPKLLGKTVRMGNSFSTAGLAKAVQKYNSRKSRSDDDDDDDDDDDEQQQEEKEEEGSGNILASWVPHLFLNPKDPVCSEYISYFEHRKTMKKIRAVKTERVASQNSKRALIASLVDIHLDPFYLLPSANLIINESPSKSFPQDHELEQWWQPDLKLKRQEFLWNDLS